MKSIPNYTVPNNGALGLIVVPNDGTPSLLEWSTKGVGPVRREFQFKWGLEPGDWNSPFYVTGEEAFLWAWEWAQGRLDGNDAPWNLSEVLWMAVEYEVASVLQGRVMFPLCKTVAVSSDKSEVVSFIKEHIPPGKRGPVLFDTATGVQEVVVGDGGTASTDTGECVAGDWGVATASGWGRATVGRRGKAMAGAHGKAFAGDKGSATAGFGGYAKTGWGGEAIAGDFGDAISGFGGTAIAGYGGSAESGDFGVARAGSEGTAIVGENGKAFVGAGGRAKAGKGGSMLFADTVLLHVGVDDILPDVFYTLNTDGNPIVSPKQLKWFK